MHSILWLVSDLGGCGAYRAYMPALSLEPAIENHFLLHHIAAFSKIDRELSGIDLVVFQRAIGEGAKHWMERCIELGIPTVVELDDNLFNVPKHNPGSAFWHQKGSVRVLREQLAMCNHVLVSTRPLAAVLQAQMGWRTAEKITVAPNHLHPTVWGEAMLWPRVDNLGRTVIGWQGSQTHNTDFKAVIDALAQIVRDFPEVMLRFFGSLPAPIQGRVPEDRWQIVKGVSYEQYPATLAHLNFDIGIAPVTDSIFNRSKSNIKFLEYGALSIPCVASRVYPYATTVRHGETGFLASTPADWYDALAALVRSADLRKTVGQAAHADVWKRFGPDCVKPWRDLFTTLLAPAGPSHKVPVEFSNGKHRRDIQLSPQTEFRRSPGAAHDPRAESGGHPHDQV
jgi:hypothetical protein